MASGLSHHDLRRIEVTTAVDDTASIPKVPDAGRVRDHHGTRVQVMHNGVLVEADGYYGPVITEVVRRLRGHHEPQEERAFHAVVERLAASADEPLVVELGSYWAYYSLWAGAAVPGTRHLCVEPDEDNLEVGRRNFALNGRDGEFVHAAVGRRHGARLPMQTETRGFRMVPTITVDGLLRDRGEERIDLLVCDVQGAELEMLRGARATIAAGGLRFLVLSTHHHQICGDPLLHQRCLEAVQAAGGHVIAEHTVAESCSGDGLIAASFDRRDRDLVVPVTIVRARDSAFGELEHDLARAVGGVVSPRRAAWVLRHRARLLRGSWRARRSRG